MPAELDNMDPEMDQEMDSGMDQEMGAEGPEMGMGDQEGAMAKQELIKLANYASNLQEHIADDEQLEAWVQSKITIAATNIASVYHYLAYEKKIGEYGDRLDSETMSESKRRALKGWLMEAKSKVKELKKAHAEKVKDKQIEEGILSGGDQECAECGGSGMVQVPGRSVPEATKEKVRKYNTMVKATKAAHKRIDANHNGIPDDEEMAEGFGEAEPKEMKTGDTKKTRTGVMTKTDKGVKHTNTAYKDDGEADDKSGKGKKTHAKAKDADTKKAEKGNDIKLPKHPGGTYGMKNGEKFDNRKEAKVDESKPSAGLSKEKKSSVVKDAKAGKDIGKPGKSFDKTAKAAGGGKKGEKIAAAAMWKNIKETTSYIAEKAKSDKDLPGKQEKIDVNKNGKIDGDDLAKLRAGKKETVKESTEVSRLRELTGRLNQNEAQSLNESGDVASIRALTKKLLG